MKTKQPTFSRRELLLGAAALTAPAPAARSASRSHPPFEALAFLQAGCGGRVRRARVVMHGAAAEADVLALLRRAAGGRDARDVTRLGDGPRVARLDFGVFTASVERFPGGTGESFCTFYCTEGALHLDLTRPDGAWVFCPADPALPVSRSA